MDIPSNINVSDLQISKEARKGAVDKLGDIFSVVSVGL